MNYIISWSEKRVHSDLLKGRELDLELRCNSKYKFIYIFQGLSFILLILLGYYLWTESKWFVLIPIILLFTPLMGSLIHMITGLMFSPLIKLIEKYLKYD